MTLGKGPCEVSSAFYQRQQITILGMVLIYWDNNKITREYIDVVSEILNHDSKFVHDAIKILVSKRKTILENLKTLYCFNDGGKHFASYETNNTIISLIPELLPNLNYVEWNRFAPYHGKADCDSHFGMLAKWMKQIEKVNNINTINDFELMTKKSEKGKYPTRIYKLDKADFVRKHICKLEFGSNAANKITNSFTVIMERINNKYRYVRKDNANGEAYEVKMTKKTLDDKRATKIFIPQQSKGDDDEIDIDLTVPQASNMLHPIASSAKTTPLQRKLPPIANTADISALFTISHRLMPTASTSTAAGFISIRVNDSQQLKTASVSRATNRMLGKASNPIVLN